MSSSASSPERHKCVDIEQFILDPLPGAKEELVSRPRGGGPLPNPRAISHWGQYFAFGKGLQARLACRGRSSWMTGSPLWVRQAPAAPTGHCCWPGRPWTTPTPCAACTWRKGTSCGQPGPRGWTRGTLEGRRHHSSSSIAPPPPPPLSAQQALLLGFSWHRGPEKRSTCNDAGADVPLAIRICSGKVSPPPPTPHAG